MAKPSLNNNAMYAYRYLQEKYKLKPFQAAGVVGNLMQESTFNTGARNAGDGRDGSDSIGIGQWNGDRSRNMRAFAGDQSNVLDRQLDFVMHEMSGKGGNGGGSEAYAYDRLMNAENVHDATAAMISYERPSGWSRNNPTAGHGFDNRLAWAGEVMGMTPEQIAAASPSSAAAQAVAQAQAPAQQGQQTAAADAPKAADEPLIKLPKIFPDKIMGVDTKKGLNVLGGLGEMMVKQDQANNAQIAAAGQAGANRRASAQPVQIAANPAPMFGTAGGGQIPMGAAEIDEMKKKLLMQRLGGLGGLGGFGRG